MAPENEWRWSIWTVLLAVGMALILLTFWQPEPAQTRSCGVYVGGLTPNGQKTDSLMSQNSAKLPNIQAAVRLENSTARNRAGFGISTRADPARWGSELGASWYVDWTVAERRHAQTPEHWQMVRLSPGCIAPAVERIRWLALHYPGDVWIIGNEPDVIWQDALTPEEYASVYHELYGVIKDADPSAKVAVAGISQITPLRLAYLERVLAAYERAFGKPLPADWWTLHAYTLREERDSWGVEIPPGMDTWQGLLAEVADHGRVDLFERQIETFRAWMAQHGYRDTPLALTEFGILMPADYGFPPEMVSAYLQETFDWLASAADAQTGYPADENRLVQRWAWFSLADVNYPNSDLANLKAGKLTTLGEAFRSAQR